MSGKVHESPEGMRTHRESLEGMGTHWESPERLGTHPAIAVTHLGAFPKSKEFVTAGTTYKRNT